MKKFGSRGFVFAAVAALLVFLIAGCATLAEKTPPSPGPEASAKYEFRAVWISTVWNLDFGRQQSEAGFRAAYNAVLDTCCAWNVNTVIFQVRPLLDAWYKSKINPWSQYITGTDNNRQGTDPGWDPLAIMVEETHKRCMEFHAWLNPFRVTNAAYTDATVPDETQADLDAMPNRQAAELLLEAYRAAGTLSADNWAVRNPGMVYRLPGSGARRLYLDPGNPAVIQHVVDTVTEIVENYDIDAIQFDDYFYPYKASYFDLAPVDQDTFDEYGAPNGYGDTQAERERWWRDNNTSLITAVKSAIGAENRKSGRAVQFGVSPFGIWASRTTDTDPPGAGSATGNTSCSYTGGVYADTRRWVTDELVDYICPQIYWEFDHVSAQYDTLVSWWAGVAAGKNVHLYTGHANYKYMEPPFWPNSDEILNQLVFDRNYSEDNYTDDYPIVKGSALFRYKYLTVESADGQPESPAVQKMAAANRLVRQRWAAYQTIVPPFPWLNPDAPQPPLNVERRGNVIRWEDAAANNTRYYVVYRAPAENGGSISAEAGIRDPRNIIAKVWRSGESFSYTDSAAQSPDNYTYIVTALNAAHAESAPAIADTPPGVPSGTL
ncbi:MAG: family 10 glycosylhydrolase [Treponema sp.]|nr:family 10 glycosylhydrolase [Treponema sp.]